MIERAARRIVLSAAFLGLAAGGAAACDDGREETSRDFYCVDADNVVLDERECDGGDHYLAHVPHTGTSYAPGARVPADVNHRFRADDRAARAQWNLPETGRVSNGSVKTGVVGKGGGAVTGKGGGSGGG